MATKVTDNSFDFGVNSYFRGNAHLLSLGSYGEKKDPAGAKAYLDPQNKIQNEHLAGDLKYGKPVSVDFSTVSQAALEVNGTIMVYGINVDIATGLDYKKASSGKLSVYNISIDEGPLQRILNNDADGARKFLADEGNDGRVVSETWIVLSAELSEHFAGSGSISAGVKGTNLQITAKGGKYGTQTITLSPGAVFAYKLHKVKKWTDHNKTRIENMEADYKG